jgi:hypothetical protein
MTVVAAFSAKFLAFSAFCILSKAKKYIVKADENLEGFPETVLKPCPSPPAFLISCF